MKEDSRVLLARYSGDSSPDSSTRGTARANQPPGEITDTDWGQVHWGHRIGSGSFAEIWAANLPLHGPVAIKMLRPDRRADPSAVADIVREADFVCRLRHRHILSALATFRPSGSGLGIALPVLDSTLAEQLGHPMHRTPCDEWFLRRQWPVERAILVGAQLASALAYLHDRVRPRQPMLSLPARETHSITTGPLPTRSAAPSPACALRPSAAAACCTAT